MLFKILLISALLLGSASYSARSSSDGCGCGECACACPCDCPQVDPTTTAMTTSTTSMRTTTTAEAPPVTDEPCYCCCCCCEVQKDSSTMIASTNTTTTTLPPPSSPTCVSCCECRGRRQEAAQVEAASQDQHEDDEADPVPIQYNDADRHQYRSMDTKAAADQNCPAGFKRSGDACFYVEKEKLDFSTAVSKCKEKGATIFSPTSLEQWREVTAMTPTFNWTWIGIEQHEDAKKPQFKGPGAMDASKLNWLVKPYKSAANGWVVWAHCAAFYHAGTSDWHYVYFYPCTWKYCSICQKNI